MRTFFRLFIFVLIVIFSGAPSFSETENYCRDKKMDQVWEDLVEKDPNDLVVQRLHALRLGICEKIEKRSLTLDQGIEIFEKEREKAVQKRFEEGRGKKKDRAF